MKLLQFLIVSLWSAVAFVSAVSLTDNNNQFTLKNDYATIVINKKSGCLTSMKYAGNNQEFLNRSYIDAQGGKVYFTPNSYKIIKNTSSHVEVSFTDTNRNGLAVDWEVRYTMLTDTRGVYFSLTHTHKADYADLDYGEIRLVLRLKSAVFNWLQTSDEVGEYMPSPADQTKCEQNILGPKEACRLPNGKALHKYDYSVDMKKHDVHGFSSKDGLGCWFVIPSLEWKNGGAYNRDLACHQGGNDSLQIMYMSSGHYGAGDTEPKRGENWNKVYGPYLIYLNKASSPQTSWRDAKNKAAAEKKLWPYAFVSQPEYIKNRGKVSGSVTIKDQLTNNSLRLEDATVVLVQPESNKEAIPHKQWRHYSYWAHSLNGSPASFTIDNVTPGTYQLRAWSKGIVGEFISNQLVTVKAGQTTNVGNLTFTEKRVGPTAWEIGVPDRTAKEFKHGNHFNQWGLYHKFAQEFPNSVNFRIGKSNIANDWNYCHVSIKGNNGKYQAIPWNVFFDMNKIPTGTSVLRLSVAASSSTAISVTLNGKASSTKEVANLPDDAAIRRDAISGIFREIEFKFAPNDFKIGENKLVLNARKTGGYTGTYQYDGIMYDHLRMETPGINGGSSQPQQPQTTQQPQQPVRTTTVVRTTTRTTTTNKPQNTGSSGSCVPQWGQCGGANYNGSTNCCQGKCNKLNDWYSQCN